MSAHEFLPWMRRSTAEIVPVLPEQNDETADSPRALERRSFVHLLGVSGLVIAFGPGGVRRLDAAERLLAGAADPWSPHPFIAWVIARYRLQSC